MVLSRSAEISRNGVPGSDPGKGFFRFFSPKKGLREPPPNSIRMLKIHRDICGYCGCCVSVCPEGSLELIDAYLDVDASCTSCGICAKVCPLGALEVNHEGNL
jgi:ferredoxin